MSDNGDGTYDDFGDPADPAGNVPFTMDYASALEQTRASLTTLEIDLLSALVAAPDNELRAGQIATLLGITHHAALNGAIVRLAKKLTKVVGVEAPKRRDGTPRWWHVVAQGRYSADHSLFFWKLRPALRDAAIEVGICSADGGLFPDGNEVREVSDGVIFEGALKVVRVNAYERNPVARRRCIEHHGATCAVCGFDFGSIYGPIAEGVIHVHHLRPIADCGGEDYQVDPITELRPVCPNCHVVLHLRRSPLSIEELRDIVDQRRSATL